MKLAVIAVTSRGSQIAEKVRQGLDACGHEVRVCAAGKWTGSGVGERVTVHAGALKELFAGLFRECDGLVCIMAAGIVVRCIAPLLQSKFADPAVVVVDELGHFAISLLSGHVGGGNDLSRRVAEMLGATAVVTTASDLQKKPAPDYLAKRMGWRIERKEALTQISAAIVNDLPLTVYCDPAYTEWASEHGFRDITDTTCWGAPAESGAEDAIDGATGDGKRNELALVIGVRQPPATYSGVWAGLRPPHLVVGVGCRRGVAGEAVLSAIRQTFAEARLSMHALAVVASVDLKKDEAGLLAATAALGVPNIWVAREQIASLPVEYARSAFVRQAIGVDGVCEPAALIGTGHPEQAIMLVRKRTFPGVTVAVCAYNAVWARYAQERAGGE